MKEHREMKPGSNHAKLPRNAMLKVRILYLLLLLLMFYLMYDFIVVVFVIDTISLLQNQ